jgi:hypothetical protein
MSNVNVPLEIRQKLAGHASQDMNKHYTQLELETVRRAGESISRLPGKASDAPQKRGQLLITGPVGSSSNARKPKSLYTASRTSALNPRPASEHSVFDLVLSNTTLSLSYSRMIGEKPLFNLWRHR